MAVTMIGISTLVYQTLVHFIYRVFRLTDQTFEWALFQHMLPSLFLQLLVVIVIYVPVRRWFEGSSKEERGRRRIVEQAGIGARQQESYIERRRDERDR